MIRRAACIVLIASTLVLIGTAPALAAKEKFVRNKPHVNVGTIGQVQPGESITIHLTLLNLGRLTGQSRDEQPCSAELDARYFGTENPAALPLDERLGVRLEPGEPLEFAFTPGEPLPIIYAIVARNIVNVDGVICVLRGTVSVHVVADGRTRRVQPLRPEDFFVLDPQR